MGYVASMPKRKPKQLATTRKGGAYRVFVSHATADKWIATTICEKLEAAGAETFRDDRDIGGGDDIPDSIRREIKRSDELLVLLTPVSIKRDWVLLEIGAAWGSSKRRRIMPVMCHVDVEQIPDLLKSRKAIHINGLDDYFREVEQRISRRTPT
jgi:predicted nucleotide-binding protein